MIVLLAIGFDRIFRATLIGLFGEWQSSPEASYGLVLACTAAFVAARRWPEFSRAASRDAAGWGGVAAATAGAFLYLVGYLGADVFLTRVSLIVVLAGAIWALAGRAALRTVAAPVVFLLIAIPLPALVINEITLPLQLAASRLAEATLSAASIPVYRDGNLLVLPAGTLEVAEACSGLRSAVSLGAVGILLAWATEPTIPRRALIVAITVPIAVVMNALRIAATGLTVEATGNPVSADAHAFMGWIVFAVSTLLLLLIQWALDPSRRAAHRPPLTAAEPAA